MFVIDGDHVHLREGAHAIISATTAVAKVAAAAAAPSSLGTNWPPTVAITPVAQSQVQRSRKNATPLFMGTKEGVGSAGLHTKQESLFSHAQINGGHQLHQGFIGKDVFGERQGALQQSRNVTFSNVRNSNGQKMTSLGSRSDGPASNAGKSPALDFVEISSASYGASAATRKNDLMYGGRQGVRYSFHMLFFLPAVIPGVSQL